MTSDLAKTYDPSAVEAEAYRVWLAEGCFGADPADPGAPYCIVIPPPNVTGALHLGHAINCTLQDILIRQHRMRGFNTLWVPGIDHAGIATQAVVEKQLKEKENKTRHDLGREALVARIWEWKQQYGDRILQQLKRIGASCDWSRTRFTLDDSLARAVRETFFKLFKNGLIYRGKRLVNWDVFLQTSVSDDEIYHEAVKTNLWHVKYPIEGTSDYLVVATTRPETMLGDTAVAVHSEDPRWSMFIGEKVRLPLMGRLIPIIADDILVDPKFGSGVVKVTPAHDPNDYAVWQRHQGKEDEIDILNILTPDGKINESGGPYAGLTRNAARKKVVEDLSHEGLLLKEEPYETQVGHSDRSKTPIEPFLSDQWFVKMAPLAEPALQAVSEKKVRFTPDRYAQGYLAWLGEKRDWPVSRQLWWGHRIPVWSKTYPAAAALETELGSLREKIGGDSAVAFQIHLAAEGSRQLLACVRPGHPELERLIELGGFAQDPDVLDTWFSSALWPHSTLGWPEQTPDLKKWYPTSVLVTSRDIITLWVARMVMTGLYNMSGIPFHDVFIHPTILDGKGERMAKTKGNGIDPVEIIETHGADALRLALTQMATETQDVRMPVKKDSQGRNTSEKFDLGRNFCNKLWNAARFTLANLETVAPAAVDESKWSPADRWIMSRLARTISEIDAAIGSYRFDTYAKLCYDFFWRDLCDWYVEAIKPAMKDPARAVQTSHVLASVLDAVLRLMHPMIPFITETIWWRLNEVRPERGIAGRLTLPPSPRLVKAAWPTAEGVADEAAETLFARLQDIIVAIRNVRNEHKADAKKPVEVSILATEDASRPIRENRELIELLATCELKATAVSLPSPPGAMRATAGGCEILIEGLAPAQSQAPNEKARLDVRKRIDALRARLSNESYTAKAPAHLVQQTRDQLAEAEDEQRKLGCPG